MGFGGFSWKRALGITRAKQKLSRSIGIPLTKSGRQRKFGAMLGGGILGGILGGIPVHSAKMHDNDETSGSDGNHNNGLQKTDHNDVSSDQGIISCLGAAIICPLILYGIVAGNGPVVAIGGITAIALIYICNNQSKIQAEENRKKREIVIRKVYSLIKKANASEFPEIKSLTRGSFQKRHFAEELRKNHLTALIAIRQDNDKEIDEIISELANYNTMSDILEDWEERSACILKLAKNRNNPEAAYIIHGINEGSEEAKEIRDRATRLYQQSLEKRETEPLAQYQSNQPPQEQPPSSPQQPLRPRQRVEW